jgi:hypothetical protein
MGPVRTPGCVLTLVERRSGFTMIRKLRALTAEEATAAAAVVIRRMPEKFCTLTFDNRHRVSIQRLGRSRNTQIRLLARLAHGCRCQSAIALISLSRLKLGRLSPSLPVVDYATNVS